MFCKKCGRRMKRAISFSKEKTETYFRCPSCWFKSDCKKFDFSDSQIMQKKYITNSVAPPNRKGARNVQRIHNNNQRAKKA